MARRLRIDVGGFVYHVINRRVGRQRLFGGTGDCAASEKVLAEVCAMFPGVWLVAECLMPNHWHLILWTTDDGEMSRLMQRLIVSHKRRSHAHRGSTGTGPQHCLRPLASRSMACAAAVH